MTVSDSESDSDSESESERKCERGCVKRQSFERTPAALGSYPFVLLYFPLSLFIMHLPVFADT